jgi:hypothetical protein
MWDILFGWTCSYHVHIYGTYLKHNHQVWWDAVIKNQPGLARAVGIGMNADELARNEQLTEWTVKDLNKAPLSAEPRFWRQQLAVSHGYKPYQPYLTIKQQQLGYSQLFSQDLKAPKAKTIQAEMELLGLI